jgi:hypothetical protein
MFSLLKAIFAGGNGAGAQSERSLSHPRDIRTGDILKFGYLPQSELSNKEFEVAQINTYIYGDLCYPEIVLQGRAGELFYMMVEEEDGDEYLGICKKIPKADFESVIGEQSLDKILQKGLGGRLKLAWKLAEFEDWLVNDYAEVDDKIVGSFVKGDARYLSDAEMARQEKFSSYILQDKSGEYAIEIEVYASGEIEACATIYHELSALEEMWPSKNI